MKGVPCRHGFRPEHLAGHGYHREGRLQRKDEPFCSIISAFYRIRIFGFYASGDPAIQAIVKYLSDIPLQKQEPVMIRMAEGAGFIVYTLEFCPRCEILKEFLTERHIPYTVADMSSAKALAFEAGMNAIFVQEAPVLQSGKRFLTSRDLFTGDTINEDKILQARPGDAVTGISRQTTLDGIAIPSMPPVRTSDGHILDWDRDRIVKQILKGNPAG